MTQQSSSAINWGGQPNTYFAADTSANAGADQGFTPELTGTAQPVEFKDVASIPPNQKCALGDGNFEGFTGKVYKCSGCGTLYHENCLNVQLQSGICKICERIFLY